MTIHASPVPMRTASRSRSCLRCLPRTRLIWLMACLQLSGCAGYQHFTAGKAQIESGQPVEGVLQLKQAMASDPSNSEYRRTYFDQRDRAVSLVMRRMDLAIETGQFDLAQAELEAAARLAEQDPRVRAGADRIQSARRHWQMLDAAEKLAAQTLLDEALAQARQVLAEQPQHRRASLLQRQWQRLQADLSGRESGVHPKLQSTYRKPVSLSFSNATLLQVFEALKLASGLNFMFDREVRSDQRVTISVSQKSVEDVLRLLLATNQLDKRVLDEDTVLIYPMTPQKSREYQELVTRSFYLSHADVNKAANLVKNIAKARDVFVDEALNLLVVRDSLEVIRLAEKLLANQDMAEPEVVLELEVLEVSISRLTELGLRWPESVSGSLVGSSGKPGLLSLDEARNINSSLVRLQLNDPLVGAQLRARRGDSNLLANPRIRVRNRQTAKILIGERVPVITTTSTANVGVSESVNYLDVGLKLEIEPSVSLDDDVAMRVALEVSNILETITRATGTTAYRLGTRNAATQLRVRDGETQVLAGLIQRDERRSNAGVPGLNDVPWVNKLFGQSNDTDTKTEIVLLITPHVVRNVTVPGAGRIEILSGTDAATGAAPIQLRPAIGQGQGGAGMPGTRPGVGSAPEPGPASVPASRPNLPDITRGIPGMGATDSPAPPPAASQGGFYPPPVVPK